MKQKRHESGEAGDNQGMKVGREISQLLLQYPAFDIRDTSGIHWTDDKSNTR